jgi:HEPN domain-containing protein/predicted nucleotidyltransferase
MDDTRRVAEAIVRAVDPVSITVFGSVAAAGEGEDLDLLIITDEGSKDGDPAMRVHRCLKEFYKEFAIDPFVLPAPRVVEFFGKGSPFLDVIAREGRALYMRGAAREWLKEAEGEMEMARYLAGGGYFKGACYHAQQSIEKSVKAMLLAQGWTLEKTHSLERLVALADQRGVTLDVSDEDVVFVDSIYRGRYPAEAGLLPFGEPSPEDAARAVEIAERMIGRGRKAIP